MRVDPELALWRRAMLAGPESVPASAFTDQAWDRLWAAAATPSA
jgi:hypothetical protein